MDTVMTLTLHGEKETALQETLNGLTETIHQLEGTLSATREDSEIFALNRDGQAELSSCAAQLLEEALALCEETGGALDITAYPALEVWGFPSGEYRVPSGEELEALAAGIDYTQVAIARPSAGSPASARLRGGGKVDLGAVAKGFLGDTLAAQLEQAGVTSALLDLGQSSIQAVGAKPDGSPWRIGIRDPAGEGYLAVVELTGRAMGTSGGYQRFFEEDGQTYWHILDPDTAAPARSGLASVTVIAPSGLVCDGLSTALFVMGLEEGTAFWRAHRDFEAVFLTEDGEIIITSGLKESFSLAQGYEGTGVTVLE
ncbi:MAG: FAD:protein FMN transferase [Lawsonibacter sp.]|nr:FAD:protein FMN transferase [Lawsonibacter sp.]